MLKGELFTQISLAQLQRLMVNPGWGFQEKHNGERHTLCKQGGVIQDFNREGEESQRPVAKAIKDILLRHPLDFVIETEYVEKEHKLYIFDALILGDESLVHDEYEYRETRYHATFDGFHAAIVPVETVRTEAAKKALLLRLASIRAEGIICRKMKATYKQGRSGQHYKFKFLKECDCVVIGPSPEGKDSVRVGVYDERGRLHEVCGVSLRGKFHLMAGQVVKVQYNYATRSRKIKEPVLLERRFDKRPQDCVIGQLVVNKNFTA